MNTEDAIREEINAAFRNSAPLIEHWPVYYSPSTKEGWIVHPTQFRSGDHAWLMQHEDAIMVTNAYDVFDLMYLCELSKRSMNLDVVPTGER